VRLELRQKLEDGAVAILRIGVQRRAQRAPARSTPAAEIGAS
jgi:hypothetical protein